MKMSKALNNGWVLIAKHTPLGNGEALTPALSQRERET